MCGMADVKSFAVNPEEGLKEDIKALAACEAYKNSKIRIMPDAHRGKGAVVGSAITFTDKIVPSTVGVDIACRVSAFKVPSYTDNRDDLKALDEVVHRVVPAGFHIHDKQPDVYFPYKELHCWHAFSEDERDHMMRSMGTLGSGNHYLSLEQDYDTKDTYLIVHCGTRSLGLKAEGHYEGLAVGDGYIEGEALEHYLEDMALLNIWSSLSHQEIFKAIAGEMGWKTYDFISSVHNYVDVDNGIVRKGAISAQRGQLGLIPLNMADGTLIVKGKGNESWNCSLPHGAGRAMSRGKAKKSLSMDEYEAYMKMKAVYSTTVCPETLDEAPMAYKSADAIKRAIVPNAKVLAHLAPVYNFKATK